MEGVPNWKVTSENQHTFNCIQEKTGSPKMSIIKNPTLTFDLTQIQVMKSNERHFFHYTEHTFHCIIIHIIKKTKTKTKHNKTQ